jgi:hypothetical protein
LLQRVAVVLVLCFAVCSTASAQQLEVQPRLSLGVLGGQLPTAGAGLRAQIIGGRWGAYASVHERAVAVLACEDTHPSGCDGGFTTELSIGLTGITSDAESATGYLQAGGGLLRESGSFLFVEGEIGLRSPVGRAFGWHLGAHGKVFPRGNNNDYWMLEAVLGASVRIGG